jgi:hypothetical protein
VFKLLPVILSDDGRMSALASAQDDQRQRKCNFGRFQQAVSHSANSTHSDQSHIETFPDPIDASYITSCAPNPRRSFSIDLNVCANANLAKASFVVLDAVGFPHDLTSRWSWAGLIAGRIETSGIHGEKLTVFATRLGN